MIIIVVAALAILAVPLTGGSLAPLARLQIRRAWVVWTGMLVQLPITLIPGFPATLGQIVHVLSFGLAGIFVWSNRHVPGALIIGAGGAMNLIAIIANGGTMPASEWAWRTAGFAPATGSFENSGVLESARLPWLGDVLAVPESWPLSNVFSVGDMVIVVGLAYLVHRTCRASDAPAITSASADGELVTKAKSRPAHAA